MPGSPNFFAAFPSYLQDFVSPSGRLSILPARLVRATFLLVVIFVSFSPSIGTAQTSDSLSTRMKPDRVSSSQNQRPVEFVAGDSLVLHLSGEDRLAMLFGKASVKMESAQLDAHRIDILFRKEELRASGLLADTGWVGKPKFRRGEESFEGEELAFNLQTGRGRVQGARTRIEEGILRASVVKALEDSVLFIRNGVYTTCDCTDNPSYSLRSSKMKLVNQKWIYTGPLQLFLFNIPTPLWLPFGFLPAQDNRRSGPLPPNYGEDEFGFYFRDWGWYFALSDYMDLQLQAGLWTKGSWEARSLFRYRKRYGFDGQLELNTARFRNGEKGDPDFSIRKTGSFRWSHNQTIGSSSSFSSNVNLSSSSYLRAVSQNYDDRTRQNLQSTLRFTRRWSSRTLSVQLNQNQVLTTDEVSMTLPNLSFSQRSFKPLASRSRLPGQTERFYEKITLSYNFLLNNRFNFRPLSDEALIAMGDSAATRISWYDALRSPKDFRRATGSADQFMFRATHRVPISAPFSVKRLPLLGTFRLNLSPSFNYTEDWFIRTDRKTLRPDSSGITTSSVSSFFALRQFSTGVSANTIFYGLFPVRFGPYSAIRHTVRPSLSFNYRPDFSRSKWGYTRTYTDASGNEVRYPIAAGVGTGTQQQLGFSVTNTFETHRVPGDSTETGLPGSARSVKLLDLSLSSSYNFAADSLRMGSLLLNARTKLLGQIDVDFRSSFSPYRVSDRGQVINRSSFSFPGAPLGRLTRADLTIRTALRSKTGRGDRPLTTPRAGYGNATNDVFNPTASFFQSNLATNYTDFSIPWSLGFDFTYGVSKTGVTTIRRAIVNTTFDFSLTPNWKIASRTGYDFQTKELVTTNISVARDFCCWQMSINWIPFGDFQSWGFDLHVKSKRLKDLLRIRQPKSDVKDRFGSFLR